MDTYSFLILLHVVGTILGTGGATVAEFQITRALKDRRVSDEERALMHVNYSMIRAGMAIMLLSVVGMVAYFMTVGSDVIFTSERLWIKELMLLMVFINAVLLHKRIVPLWLGASLSFTSWWGATLLGLAGNLPYSFTTYLLGYVVAIFAIAALSHLLRGMAMRGALGRSTILLIFFGGLTAVAIFTYTLISGDKAREDAAKEAAAEIPADYRMLSHTVSFDYPGGTHTARYDFAVDAAGVVQSFTVADVDPENQGRFAEYTLAARELIVGKPLGELTPIDVLNGSSLTTAGFNESLLKLQADL